MQVNSMNNQSFGGHVVVSGIMSKKYNKEVYPYINKLLDTKYDFQLMEKYKPFRDYLQIEAYDHGKKVFEKRNGLFESYKKAMDSMLKALNIN